MSKDNSLYASTNLMLAAESLGIGSCLIGFAQIAFDRDKHIHKLLNIGKNTVYNTLVLGYPKYKYYRMPERKKAKFKVE